jgi:hypothetical protein
MHRLAKKQKLATMSGSSSGFVAGGQQEVVMGEAAFAEFEAARSRKQQVPSSSFQKRGSLGKPEPLPGGDGPGRSKQLAGQSDTRDLKLWLRPPALLRLSVSLGAPRLVSDRGGVVT